MLFIVIFQAKFFTETRLLQRQVTVQLLSLPNATATPFQNAAASAPAPASIFIGTGTFPSHQLYRFMISKISQVLHAQGGNIAEHLVANGLARVVDWHAGMLATGGGMERLRAAERAAKEKRLKLYASAPTPAVKSNGAVAPNGNARSFDAVVTRVWSGDQISVAERDKPKERRIQFSSTRAPK